MIIKKNLDEKSEPWKSGILFTRKTHENRRVEALWQQERAALIVKAREREREAVTTPIACFWVRGTRGGNWLPKTIKKYNINK